MKALITGAGGQLAMALERTAPAGADLVSLTIDDLDIADAAATMAAVERLRPELILNAAAYTAVDRAESEVDLAFAANRDGAANLAQAAKTDRGETGPRLHGLRLRRRGGAGLRARRADRSPRRLRRVQAGRGAGGYRSGQ